MKIIRILSINGVNQSLKYYPKISVYYERERINLSLIMVAVVIVSTLLIGPALTGSYRSALADTSSGCKNSADKISSKAEAHQSNNVCGIELSRDSPILNLFGKKINDQVPMEFPYQPTSAPSNSQVFNVIRIHIASIRSR